MSFAIPVGPALWRAGEPRGGTVRTVVIGVAVGLALTTGVAIGRASDRDETVLTAQVSSADHETDEGYFSLGADATVIAKPGSSLFQFLARHKGRRVSMSVADADARDLARLDRNR
jgi:hypothetical protein